MTINYDPNADDDFFPMSGEEKARKLHALARLARNTHKLYKVADLLREFDEDSAQQIFTIANRIDHAFEVMTVPNFPKFPKD